MYIRNFVTTQIIIEAPAVVLYVHIITIHTSPQSYMIMYIYIHMCVAAGYHVRLSRIYRQPVS